MTRVSGFVGVESYDLVLYLAKVAKYLYDFDKDGNHLGEASVLVLDKSNDNSLRSCIDFIDNMDGETVNYCGFEFATSCSDFSDYTIVLIYYGRNLEEDFSICDDLYLVTDYQKHNTEVIKEINVGETTYPFLVVRDRINSKITPDSIFYDTDTCVHFTSKENDLIEIQDTQSDLAARVALQYDGRIDMRGLSESMNSFIIKALNADYQEKDIKTAIKKAVKEK